MSELDANVIVDGQKAMATVAVTGEVVKDGGTIDATCVVKDSNGKNHLAVKIIKTENEPAETSAINAQVLTSNNELVVATQEQEGTLSASNSEIDFNCLVEKENNEKQRAIKTVELTGTIIKDGGAVDASCIVQTENGAQKAIKTYNLGGGGGFPDWQLGDRLNNKASFVCYFNSVNPDTSATQKYAVFVLDATYRMLTTKYADANNTTNYIPQSYSSTTNATNATESATYNTDYMVNNNSAESQAPAFFGARASTTVTFKGTTYNAQVPNLYEMVQISNNYSALDAVDTTATSNPTKTLNSMLASGVWSSNRKSGTSKDAFIRKKTSSSSYNMASGGSYYGVVPVIEIPVPAE